MAARGSARVRPARPAAPAGAPLSPGAHALWLAMAVALALRALAAVLPGRWLWGVDLGRDLAPAAFLLPSALTAALLVPGIARPLARAIPAGARGAAAMGLLLAAAMAACAWAFPDVIQFTGDSGMRHGAFASTDHPLLLVPQAMPGDLWLHWALPRWLDAHAHWPAERTDRALGALLAFLNGVAAWRLARARGFEGAAGLAVMTAAGWTASLALFSGYAKSFVELGVVTLAAAAALAGVVRGGRGLVALGLLASAAIVLHRSGVLLLPAWLAGVALVAARERGAAWKRPALVLSALAPVATLAWLGPRLAHTVTDFDVAHHVTHEGAAPAAVAAQLLAPLRLVDVADMLLLLVPVLPLAFAFLGRDANADEEPHARAGRLAFAALVVPPLLLALLLRPQQGLFRDWDVFVMTGVSIAAWIALAAGARLAREPRAAWLALPLALTAIVPSVQWLAHQSDPASALPRARALLAGPPARPADERARGFDRLSLLYLWRDDATDMAEACSLSVEAAPNPRVLAEWGMAETLRQRYDAAQAHYLRAVTLNPGFALGWKGVAATSSALGDVPHMEQAVSALMRLEPHGDTVRDAAAWLERNRPAGRVR